MGSKIDTVEKARQVAEEWLVDVGVSKTPTINDVARLAGISKMTVSRVINNSLSVKTSTRQVVDAIIKTIEYGPDPQARGLSIRRSFLVGLIYDNPNPQYVVNVLQGVLNGLHGTGFELVVNACDRNSPTFIEDSRRFIERQKLFGVIFTPSVSEDPRLADVLRQAGCAYVRIASISLDEPEHMIVSHDYTGAIEVAEYLVDQGHEHVAHIAGQKGFRSAEERLKGFKEGLKKRGVGLSPQDIFEGQYTFQSGVECGKKLLDLSPRPTAVFAANDEMAAGVLQALRMAGLKAPDDLSVIGYDDFAVATSTWPLLSTVHSPIVKLGQRAAHQLLAEAGEIVEADEPLLPSLVIRDSSGKPPLQK